jgi:hypothetical protein
MPISKIFNRCPKSGRVIGINQVAWPKCFFILTGIIATVWYLIRVIPNPSRANYPCHQSSAPFRLSFLAYAAALVGSFFAFWKAGGFFRTTRSAATKNLLTISIIGATVLLLGAVQSAFAVTGTGKGIFPGRVSWVYNSKAALWTGTGNYWDAALNPQAEYDKSFTAGIESLTGVTGNTAAWNLLFKYFNDRHGRAGTGYTSGDKIFIKINQNNTSNPGGGISGSNGNPQTAAAICRSLVNAGVPPADIYLGDPSRAVTTNISNAVKAVNSAINIADYFNNGGSSPITLGYGLNNKVSNVVLNSRYMINCALMKGHGDKPTFCGKNLFGVTGLFNDASKNNHPNSNDAWGLLMVHKSVGDKTVLWFMDAMYPNVNLNGIPNAKVNVPVIAKNTQLASFIMSIDGAANESVAYDFFQAIYNTRWDDGYVKYVANNGGGVYDVWDANKKYTRDRDPNANGIELKLIRPDLNQFGTLALSAATGTIAENAGTATINVNRTNGSLGSVSVNYATSNGTAIAGTEYTATSGTLTFADGVTSRSFSVAITDDAVTDGNKTFNVTLSNVAGGATLGTPSAEVVTIMDNEVPRTTLPAKLQAEDYKAGGEGIGYHDGTTGNSGGAYKPDDNVDIQTCADAGDGYNIGWTTAGEWLAYDVIVPTTGLFKFTARVASAVVGTKTLKLQIDGVDVANAAVSFTDATGWGSWIDATSGTFTLAAGNHELRLYWVTASSNVNWFDITGTTTPNNPPVISITSPANNQNFAAVPSNVTVAATATDADGSVAKVDFYNGTTLAGTVTVIPYKFTFAGLAAGSYLLKAIATDNQGATASDQVTVTVGTITPVTINITAAKDAYVRGGINAATNYGNALVLEAKTQSTDPSYSRIFYLNFSLSDFSGTVNGATLKLYRSAGLANVAMTLYRCSDVPWLETGLNWNNKIVEGSAEATTTLIANGWNNFNVGAYVAAQKAAGATSITFIGIGAEQGGTAQQVFSSREGANKPVLAVTYLAPGGFAKKPALSSAKEIVYSLSIGSIQGNRLQISLPNDGIYSLEIYSLLGTKVSNFSYSRGKIGFNAIPVNLSQGVYVTRLKSNGMEIEKPIWVFK